MRVSQTDVAALLEERLRELLAAGTPLAEITADAVLADVEARMQQEATESEPVAAAVGSDEQIAAQARDDERFLHELRHRASRTRRPLYLAENGLGAFFPTLITSLDEETGQGIAELVGTIGARLQVGLLFEEKPGRGRLPELWIAPGWLRVLVSQMSRYTDVTYEFASDASYPYDSRQITRGEQPVSLDDTYVAAIESDRHQLRLSVHPFSVRDTWYDEEEAAGTLERIIEAALAGNVDAQVKARYQTAVPVEMQRDASRLASLRSAVELLAPLVEIQQGALPLRIAQIDTNIENTATEIAAAQTMLLGLLAAKNALSRERELLEVERTHASVEVVVRAAREAARIAAMGSVREVGVVDQEGVALLRVTWQPVVLEDDGSARRTHHLIERVTMRIPLNTASGIGGITVEQGACHPHISSSKNICWGEAQGPVQQALARGEFAAVVTLITGWMSQYNRRSPYTNISEFPVTELAIGFHPEV